MRHVSASQPLAPPASAPRDSCLRPDARDGLRCRERSSATQGIGPARPQKSQAEAHVPLGRTLTGLLPVGIPGDLRMGAYAP